MMEAGTNGTCDAASLLNLHHVLTFAFIILSYKHW